MFRMRLLSSLAALLTLSSAASAAPPVHAAVAPPPPAVHTLAAAKPAIAPPKAPPVVAAPRPVIVLAKTEASRRFMTPAAPALDAREQAPHRALGLPMPRPEAHPNAVVLSRRGFISIFDPDVKLPLVVSWSTQRKMLGSKDGWNEREDVFHEDTLLPAETPQASLEDYRRSGYHRGHMVRQGERPLGVDREANQSTFSMVNILPQSPNNNVGPWGHFENFYRDHVSDTGQAAYIQAGPILEGERKTIGDGVVVPSHTYKIVVLADEGVDLKTVKPEDIGEKVKVFAVIIPNNDRDVKLGDHWAQFVVPVSQVARRTDIPGFISGFSEETRKAAWNHRPVVKRIEGADGPTFEVDGIVTRPWVPKAPREKVEKPMRKAS